MAPDAIANARRTGQRVQRHDSIATFVTTFERLLGRARPGTRSLAALGLGPDASISEIDQRIANIRETVALDILRLAVEHGLDGPDAIEAVHQCQELLQHRIDQITGG